VFFALPEGFLGLLAVRDIAGNRENRRPAIEPDHPGVDLDRDFPAIFGDLGGLKEGVPVGPQPLRDQRQAGPVFRVVNRGGRQFEQFVTGVAEALAGHVVDPEKSAGPGFSELDHKGGIADAVEQSPVLLLAPAH